MERDDVAEVRPVVVALRLLLGEEDLLEVSRQPVEVPVHDDQRLATFLFEVPPRDPLCSPAFARGVPVPRVPFAPSAWSNRVSRGRAKARASGLMRGELSRADDRRQRQRLSDSAQSSRNQPGPDHLRHVCGDRGRPGGRNWFLRVGAASGTVAQTISAYDKSFSDERYGQGTRYVSRERLQSMLDREFQSLQGSLRAARGSEVRFFAFADTVAARNFKGDNEQHGWVGVRFEREGSTTPHDVLFHIEFRDQDVAHQREALGILGVNLVHAAFHERLEPEPFLRAAFQGLSSDRLRDRRHRGDGTAFTETAARHSSRRRR